MLCEEKSSHNKQQSNSIEKISQQIIATKWMFRYLIKKFIPLYQPQMTLKNKMNVKAIYIFSFFNNKHFVLKKTNTQKNTVWNNEFFKSLFKVWIFLGEKAIISRLRSNMGKFSFKKKKYSSLPFPGSRRIFLPKRRKKIVPCI